MTISDVADTGYSGYALCFKAIEFQVPVFSVLALLLFGAKYCWQGRRSKSPRSLRRVRNGWSNCATPPGKSIEAGTAGRVKLKLYGGGVHGQRQKGLAQDSHRAITGWRVYGDRACPIVIPISCCMDLPMAFRSQAEVDYVREKMDPILIQGLEDAGFVSFGFAGGGFALLMGAEPVSRPDQAVTRSSKVWVPEGDPISYEAMEAMQLSPVVLPLTDVMTGLQTGLDRICRDTAGRLPSSCSGTRRSSTSQRYRSLIRWGYARNRQDGYSIASVPKIRQVVQ